MNVSHSAEVASPVHNNIWLYHIFNWSGFTSAKCMNIFSWSGKPVNIQPNIDFNCCDKCIYMCRPFSHLHSSSSQPYFQIRPTMVNQRKCHSCRGKNDLLGHQNAISKIKTLWWITEPVPSMPWMALMCTADMVSLSALQTTCSAHTLSLEPCVVL